ncbi:MAG: phospholipid/cholesterol/gamma-HCH transport system substrate-binding protein [Sphingomonadales bacterium]|jgi:phospholipid/cholesterol/gamma-HCH transport system substrate-binding protein|nr:phospholipid/cholesterol/gamma-HCH transport system substrate-binding protein [Sphingomonadales bacterium]
METRSNHILVGGVVLAMLIAILAFIIWLTQAGGDKDKHYDIFFKQAVDGLAKGSAVTFSGVPVGQVDSINLEPQTPEFVRVRISVSTTTPVLVGTTATIKGVGFTGVSEIQLDPPPRDAKHPRVVKEISCPSDNAKSVCPYDVPVIPPKPGGITALLNSAPELIENVTKLTERLTELLSDRNQNSIAAILANVQVMSKNLAARSDEIAATLADARIAIRQAGDSIERFGRLADTTNELLDKNGRPLMADLRRTVQSAQQSMDKLDKLMGAAQPGVETFSTRTLPEVGQLVRDLRSTSQSLRSITERLDSQGVGGVIGGEKLPDYKPGKARR